MIEVNIAKQLNNFSTQFKFCLKSDRTVIYGPSGSGKSTLLKMMAGFLQPDSGIFKIDQKDIFNSEAKIDTPVYHRRFGYLPQNFTLFPNMCILDNILYGLKVQKLEYDAKHFQQIVQRLGIEHKLNCSPSELSGGQQQRVALARILMMKPQLLLLDEPFSALDTERRDILRELLISIIDEYQIPALFITHDREEAFTFGKEMIMLDKGVIIEFGDIKKLVYHPDYVETAMLMGFSNIWKTQSVQGETVKIEGGIQLTYNPIEHQKGSFIGIKPENVRLLRDIRPEVLSKKENVFEATVKSFHHRGHYIIVCLETVSGLKVFSSLSEHAFERFEVAHQKKLFISLKRESLVLCQNRLRSQG